MNYTTTNDLLNRIPAMRVAENTVADALRFEGASMWQFLPSYIWSDVFRAVEMAKGLARACSPEERPARILALPSADRYAAMWMRLSEAAAAANGIPHRALQRRERKAALDGDRPALGDGGGHDETCGGAGSPARDGQAARSG